MKESNMLPDVIILDTYQQMKDFSELAEKNGERSEWAIDVAQTILDWMGSGLGHPEKRLSRLIEAVRAGKLDSEDDDPDDIPAFYADAIAELGQDIHRQLYTLGAYLPNGQLTYSVWPETKPTCPNDLILIRTRNLIYDPQS